MKIERAQIEAFGHFRQLDLRFSPGLNIVYGRNGAGKSTLLGFFRSVLFGFEKRKDALRYEPANGDPAGELQLSTSLGGLVARRVAGRKVEGELLLRQPNGDVLAPGRLAEALHGMTRELYFEVYAFGISELQSFERLSEGAVSEALFAAATAGARRLPAAVDALRRRSEECFRPRGKKPLNLELKRLQEIRQTLAKLEDRPAVYFAQTERLEVVEGELARLDVEQKQVQVALARLQTLNEALPDLLRLELLELEASTSEDWTGFPERAVERFEDIQRRLQSAQATLAGLDHELQGLQQARERAVVSCGPAAAPTQLALEAWKARQELRRGLPARRASAEERRVHLLREAEDVGLRPELEALMTMELGPSSRAALVELKREEALIAAGLAEQTTARDQLREELGRMATRGARLDALAKQRPVLSAEEVRAAKLTLGEVSVLGPRLDALQREAARAEEEASASRSVPTGLPTAPAPSLASSWGWLAIVAASALAVAHWLSGPALLVTQAALAAVSAWFLLQKRAQALASEALRRETQQQEAAARAEDRRRHERWQMLRAEVSAAAEALASACARAGVTGAATPQALAARQLELDGASAALESLRQTDLELGLLRAERDALEVREAAAQRALEGLRLRQARLEEALRAWSARAGVPMCATAREASEMLEAATSLRRRAQEVKLELGTLEADAAASEALDADLRARAVEWGLTGLDPEVLAEGLVSRLAELEAQEHQRTRWEDRAVQLAAERERLGALMQAEASALARLLRDAGAEGEEALRTNAARRALAQQRETAVREVRLSLASALRSPLDVARAELERWGGASELPKHLETHQARDSALRGQRDALLEERTGLRLALDSTARDEEVARLRREEEQCRARALELAQSFAVDQLALGLLAAARDRYERERQPAVVREASALFAELTQGAYPRVFVAADDGRQLLVNDARGETWSPDRLSRGTRELLFLAFRLAVIEDLAATRGVLPIILDDVLVNLDAPRSAAALRVLERLAGTHQIIALTCHEPMLSMFERAGAHRVELGNLPTPTLSPDVGVEGPFRPRWAPEAPPAAG